MNKADWTDGLSTRAWRVVNDLGLTSREQVMDSYKYGALSRYKQYTSPERYGWKTFVEVAIWLGLPAPTKPKCCQFCKRPF